MDNASTLPPPDPGLTPTRSLTPAQQEAVAHVDGPLLVAAGPGAGKTAVIAHRTARLLASGIPADRLLVVTFTRAAADEMKGRTRALAGAAAAGVLFSTYHSLAYRILRQAQPGRRLTILEEDVQFGILRHLLQHLGLPTDEDTVLKAQAELSRRANGGESGSFRPQGFSPADFGQLVQGYTAEKQRRGALDFDDLLVEALGALRGSAPLLRNLRERWHYLMVDEFQDTNPLQWEITVLLAEPRRNLCVVGDDDQAIYGWRGASPDYLISFPRQFAGCRVVKLEVNHRCPPPVVAAAGRLVAHNRQRVEKRIRPHEAAGGPPPRLLLPADSLGEAGEVLRLLQEGRRRGRLFGDFAVVYRIHDQAHAVAQALDREGVPYRALGGLPNLFRRWPAQDMLAYLRLAAGERSHALLAQVVNRPNRYIPRQALQAAAARGGDPLAALADSGALAVWQLDRVAELGAQLRRLHTMTAPEAIGYIRRTVGYDDHIREYCEKKGGNAEELLGLLAELEVSAPRAPLPAFLQEVQSYGARLERGSGGDGDGDAVTLVTCHRAKGLEFPVVILIGATDQLMPHRGAGDVEEERRLFYVAMTRAMQELHISAPRTREGREAKPSPFIAEAGLAAAAPAPAGAPGGPPAALVPSGVPGVAAAAARLQPGTHVYHARHGRGRVESVDAGGGRITVDFGGGKRISLDLQWCEAMPAFFRVLPD